MITIEFTGEVVAKGRPRVGKYSVYTPKKTRDFEEYIKLITMAKIKKPISGGLAVDIVVKKKPPKSWSKKRQKDAIAGKILATPRPDVDNYAKSILDGMGGIAFHDDSFITDLRIRKVYAEKEGAIVTIEKLEGETAY